MAWPEHDLEHFKQNTTETLSCKWWRNNAWQKHRRNAWCADTGAKPVGLTPDIWRRITRTWLQIMSCQPFQEHHNRNVPGTWPAHGRKMTGTPPEQCCKTNVIPSIQTNTWPKHGRNTTPSTAKKTWQKPFHADNNKAWPAHHKHTSRPDTGAKPNGFTANMGGTMATTRLQIMLCQPLQEQHNRNVTGTWPEHDRNMARAPQE